MCFLIDLGYFPNLPRHRKQTIRGGTGYMYVYPRDGDSVRTFNRVFEYQPKGVHLNLYIYFQVYSTQMSGLSCWVAGSMASSPCQLLGLPMSGLSASISTRSCPLTQQIRQVDISGRLRDKIMMLPYSA